jgi:hypothetical protein
MERLVLNERMVLVFGNPTGLQRISLNLQLEVFPKDGLMNKEKIK